MLKKIFCILISILCIGFIFFNSSQDGAISHGRSYYIVNKIVDILKEENISNNSTTNNNSNISNINEEKSIEGNNESNLDSDNKTNKANITEKLNIKDKLINKIRNISFIKNMTKSELDHLIRKFAHGFEFALLGLALCLFFSRFNINKYNVIIYALFLVLFTAVIDETIQININNRTSSTIDVLIDFCGGSISCILFYIFKRIFLKFKNKKNKISEDINVIEYKKIQS